MRISDWSSDVCSSDLVISDPELTVGLPPHITAATGMDALAHCIEAYCAPGYHPMAEGIAVEGMRLVKEWLPKAVTDGKDLAARAHMLAAASMGRSEEQTSELQSLMRNSYAVFCLKKKTTTACT